jgi:filamentous hemagglutinin family protein
MLTTALQAVAVAMLATPAGAQIAANTRPTGGQVAAGQATIGGNASTTLINQGSQNAVINWQTYNIGSGQTVQYAQPNTAAITLNNVVTANPSQIAGKILANGQVIIVNQSGVVFSKGSQVDTGGLVVSSAGISTKNFMAGKMVFDQAGQAGAIISNAGNITVRQAGLAALVAPQVANSGTITANLGRVILGGATTSTLDLYGDGLVALNVTGQVTQVSLGGKTVPALVTNTGTILAPGGTVVLTAAAADNVVTNLVSAGGTIAAPSLGAATGRVLVQGVGGDITIDGQVSATGTTQGTTGGQVVVDATGTVNVASGALIDASGNAGGGVVAVGTTASRAIGGATVRPTQSAAGVNLAAGSTLRANATQRGQGGRVAVLSAGLTTQLGAISATGGASGGNGGWIEVSGRNVKLAGAIDTGASHGKPGSIFVDPFNIDLGTTATGSGSTLDISAKQFSTFTGNVILDASGTISVVGAIATGPNVTSLMLEGDEGIFINAALNAAGHPVGLKSLTGAITEDASGSITASSLSAFAGAGAVDLPFQPVSTTVGVFNNTTVSAKTLSGGVAGSNGNGGVTLLQLSASNEASISGLTATGGDVTLTVTGTSTTVSGNTTTTTPNTITIDAGLSGNDVLVSTTGSVAGYSGNAITQTAGTISATGTAVGTNFGVIDEPGTAQISAASGAISLAGTVLTAEPGATGPAGSTTLTAAAGDIIEADTGILNTGTLTGSAGGTGNQGKAPIGNVDLVISNGNTVSQLESFTATGNFRLEDDTGLTVGLLTSTGGSISIFGPLTGSPVTGELFLQGPINAATSISFSNTLGITEGRDSSITSTQSGITITTTGGAFTQFVGASLTGEDISGQGPAIAITADTGVTLGGTVTAGTLAGGTYSGLAAITATGGSIIEQTAGAVRAGTLTDGGTATSGDADFLVSKGNTISTLTSMAVGGSFSLDDDIGLTVGALAAGNDISLTTAGLVLTGTLTAGTLTGTSNNGTTPYSGLLTLNVTGGNITEQSGASVRAGTLTGAVAIGGGTASSAGNADFGIAAGGDANQIANLATFTTSGNFALEDSAGLVLNSLSAGGSIAIAGPAGGSPSGVLLITGNVTADNAISLNNAVGIAEFAGVSITSTLGAVSLISGGAILQQDGATISAGAGGKTGTALTLSAGGSTDFNTYFANLGLGTVKGILFDGSLQTGPAIGATYGGTLSLTAVNGDIDEFTDAVILAGTLDGSAKSTVAGLGDVSLANTFGNTLSVLSSFTATGNFTLEDDTALSLGNLASTAGSISVAGPSGVIVMAPGSLTIAGAVTAADGISLSNALGISELKGASVSSTLAGITLSTNGSILQAAGSSLSGGESSASGTALSLTAGDAITLGGTNSAGTFSKGTWSGTAAFAAGGAIDELAGATLGAGTLTDGGKITGGDANFGLGAKNTVIASNTIATLTGFAATGSFALADSTALIVGALSAGTNVSLVAAPGITLTGALEAGTFNGSNFTGTASLAAGSGNIVEQSGAALLAGTLTDGGTATGGTANFGASAGNTISTVTGFSSKGVFALQDEIALTIGTLASGTAITITAPDGITLAGTLTAGALAGGTYTGLATLDASNGNIVEDSGASLRAGTLTGSALSASGGSLATAGNADFAVSAGNTVSTLTGFTTDGDFALESDAGLRVAALASGGAIDVFGSAAPSGSFTIAGDVTAQSSITFSSALGISEFSGASISSAQAGIALSGSSLALGGSLSADTVSLVAAQGNITQIAAGATASTGVIKTGTLFATALTGTLTGLGNISLDTASSATTGNQIVQLGQSAADGGFALADGTGLSVIGAVQAGLRATTASDLQIVAPAIDVTTGSLQIAPPKAVLPGVLSLVADQFTFSTAGDVSTRGGIVALDLLTASSGSTIFSVGTFTTDTLNFANLQNIQTQGGTLVLGSLNGISASPGNASSGGWTIGSGGNVVSLEIGAGLNLTTGDINALGLFSNGGITSSGGITVTSLFGQAENGTALFTSSNAISTLGVLNANGKLVGFSTAQTGVTGTAPGFELTDTVPLTVLGPVSAGQGAVIISVTGTAGSTPTLTIGSALAGSGDISGTDVDLSASGAISQIAGTLNAFGAGNASTQGTIALSAAGGGITLGGVVAGGTFGSQTGFKLNAGSAVLLYAGNGSISESAGATLEAGTLAAQASGNILLAAGSNTVNVIGTLGSTVEGLSLLGLSADGASGIDFTDTVSLLVADGASISGPQIGLALTGGTLSLGTKTGATLSASGDISLSAPGNIVQTGGSIIAGADVTLTAGTTKIAGSIEQFGGTIAADGTVNATATDPGAGIVQTTLTVGKSVLDSAIDAGQSISLTALDGGFTQTDSSLLGSAAVSLDFGTAINLSAGSSIEATGSNVVIASSGGSVALGGLVEGTDVLIAAGGNIAGAGRIVAGTLAAAGGGDIALTGHNQVSAIGSQSAIIQGAAAPQTLILYGLAANGAGGIHFDDFAALAIGADTGAHAVIDAAGSDAALTIDVLGKSTNGLTMGADGASSLLAGGDITLQALGNLTQSAGTIFAQGAISLASVDGSVIQTSSTATAYHGITVTAALDVDQTASTLVADFGIDITAGRNVEQSSGSKIDAAGGNLLITAGTGASGGDIGQDASVMSAYQSITLVANAGTSTPGNISQTDGSQIDAGLSVTLSSAQGSFSQGASSISGPQSVTLAFGGDVTGTGGTITSAGLGTVEQPGSISITSNAGSISFTGSSGEIAATQAGGVVLLSASGAIDINQLVAGTLSAMAGTDFEIGQLDAGTLAALAGGDIILDGPNRISNIAVVGDLPGLKSSDGNIELNDLQNLVVQSGAVIDSPVYLYGTITITAASLDLENATVLANGDVSITSSGLLSQTGGQIQSGAGNLAISGQSVSLGGLIESGLNIAVASGSFLDLGGAVYAGRPQNGVYDGSLSLQAGLQGIFAPGGVLQAGTLAAFSLGAINLGDTSNAIAQIGTAGTLTGLSAQGNIKISDSQSLTIAAPVSTTGAAVFAITGDFTDAPGIGISAPGGFSLNATGSVSIGGALASGPLTIKSGGDFADLPGASIIVDGSASIISGAAVEMGGLFQVSGTATVTATTDFFEAQGGTITVPAPGTLTAPGSITLDGVVNVPGSLFIVAGTGFTLGSTGVITAGTTNIDTTSGTAEIGGVMNVAGALAITAGAGITEDAGATITAGPASLDATSGAISIAGLLETSEPLTVTAGTDFSEATTGTMIMNGSAQGGSSMASVTAGGAITIDGLLAYPGSLRFVAGTGFTEASTGSVSSLGSNGAITISTASGDVTIDGPMAAQGPLAITAGGDIDLASNVTAASSTLASDGATTIDGVLNGGATSIMAGTDIDITGALIAGPVQLSADRDITVGGKLTSAGALTATAGRDFSDLAAAAITARSVNLSATRGDATIDGGLNSAGLLAISAGGNITQGNGETLSSGTTMSLLAPGTITLAGALYAPRIVIGDAQTSDVVWQGTTIRTDSDLRGTPDSINILNPLTGGSGVFIETGSFQQTGTSTVDPLAGALATMQLTIEGKGAARFANLVGPSTELLLVLRGGGSTTGEVDVGGLNVYYSPGNTPSQAVNLFGSVGGRFGDAASASGFSHVFSNINYQINGCPIQSVDCILLSPVLVPVQDPVNDYAEGTQRKRHQDDDALPNVGEEDY